MSLSKVGMSPDLMVQGMALSDWKIRRFDYWRKINDSQSSLWSLGGRLVWKEVLEEVPFQGRLRQQHREDYILRADVAKVAGNVCVIEEKGNQDCQERYSH